MFGLKWAEVIPNQVYVCNHIGGQYKMYNVFGFWMIEYHHHPDFYGKVKIYKPNKLFHNSYLAANYCNKHFKHTIKL